MRGIDSETVARNDTASKFGDANAKLWIRDENSAKYIGELVSEGKDCLQ